MQQDTAKNDCRNRLQCFTIDKRPICSVFTSLTTKYVDMCVLQGQIRISTRIYEDNLLINENE